MKNYLKENDSFFLNNITSGIYGNEIRFSLVRNKRTISNFHTCRDVFNEHVLSIYNQGKQVKTRFVVAVIGLTTKQAELAQDMLNSLEDYLNYTKTKVVMGGKNKSGTICFVFRGDKRWAHSPPMSSLYTLIIRIGAKHHKKGNDWAAVDVTKSNDNSQWWWATRAIPMIKHRGVENVFYKDPKNNFKDFNFGSVHSAGIMSFSQKGGSIKNKKWSFPPDPAH